MTPDDEISPAEMTRKLAEEQSDQTEPVGSDALPNATDDAGDSGSGQHEDIHSQPPAQQMAQQAHTAPGGKV